MCRIGGTKKWKMISLLVALPGVAVGYINAFVLHCSHPERPEFVPYPYLRMRTKVRDTGLVNRPQCQSMATLKKNQTRESV